MDNNTLFPGGTMITLNEEFEFTFGHSRNSKKEVTYHVRMEVQIHRDGTITSSYEVFKDSTCKKELTEEIEEIDFSLNAAIKHKVNNKAMVIVHNYQREAV